MVDCTLYLNTVDCVLTIQNEYNIKLLILSILFVFSIFMFWFSFQIDIKKSTLHLYSFIFLRGMGVVFTIFFPLLLLMLSNNVSFEMFMIFIAFFYGLGLILGIGFMIYFAWDYIKSIFGQGENKYLDGYNKKYGSKK